ncbi:MAG: hypothetical protein HKO54_08770 [Flavobacteriaceae bacterium]|nr:hypothetical protein [Flavobacteriaceae bacterium]
MSLLDICVTVIVILLGFNLKNFFRSFNKRERRFLDRLFAFHFFIAVVFHFYISKFGGDAVYYWDAPKNIPLATIWDMVNSLKASGVIYLLNYFPSTVLELSFFTGNMIYALIGYIGFIYILLAIKRLVGNTEELYDLKILNIRIFPWIWFLPNFHFWSSGIGKDTILFFCIAAFIFALPRFRKHILLLSISMLLALTIRPHILLFLLISFGIGSILDGRLKGYQKVFLFIVFVVGFISIFNYVLEFIQLESLEATAIDEYATKRSSDLNKIQTGSGVDISTYPLPIKVFTFLYRPLFFDMQGILAIAASFENAVLLVFTSVLLFKRPVRAFRRSSFLLKGIIIYFLLGSLAFSLILGNLGIMLRQKNMLIPWLVVFGLWTMYQFNMKEHASVTSN